MDWLFEKRNKSVASNAQRVVADMHRHLELQTRKAREMEDIMLRFRELNVASLEKEVVRLQRKRRELGEELADTDRALSEASAALLELQERMEKALKMEVPEQVLTQKDSSSAPAALKAKSEAATVLETLRQAHPRHLFYIHQNRVDSIIIFVAALRDSVIIESQFLTGYQDAEGRELTTAEDSMYGVRIVPNHQRELPHVTEMACPSFLLDSPSASPPIGTLVGAFEIALTSAVIVDAWQAGGVVWATTTVDGHSFAVLERMYVVSEVSWGLQSIVQVDLFGRDATSGAAIVEHVSASEEGDDE